MRPIASQSQHSRRLSCTVFTHHDNNFGVGELSGLNGQVEVTQRLGHFRVSILSALIGDEFFASLTNTELKRFLTETQVLGWNVTVKEDVDTFTDGVRLSDNTVDSRLSVKKTDKVTLKTKSASAFQIYQNMNVPGSPTRTNRAQQQ